MDLEKTVLKHLPLRIRREIGRLKFDGRELREIHIVMGTGSSVSIGSKKIYLGLRVTEADVEYIFESITGRALYAHRHTLSKGYVTVEGGIRVGICGRARVERGETVGITEVRSMLFRIPYQGECGFTEVLADAFLKGTCGMLIVAPPSGGKTTALKGLIKHLGKTDASLHISVVDERCELDMDELTDIDVDVLRGYGRGEGMQIALRVMSPDIIAIDELGDEREATQILESLGSGIRFIATAHGRSVDDAKNRKVLKPLIEAGVFDVYASIKEVEGNFGVEISMEEIK